VDPATGYLSLKKLEAWINTICPILCYIFRSNTDTTSLRSGTAIKGVLYYCTDYITKPALKTHIIFDAIRCVLHQGLTLLEGPMARNDKARVLLTRLVNNIGTKMELGSPMIATYLLGLPDHYKSHKFNPFYWQSYVKEVMKSWEEVDKEVEQDAHPEKVTLLKKAGRIIGLSPVYDYIFRPSEIEDMSLWEWITRCKRVKKKSKKSNGDADNASGVKTETPAYDDIPCDDGTDYHSDSDFEEKATDSSKSNVYNFLPGHPLSSTHATHCAPASKYKIPLILGPNLPRRDIGDKERYCATMLTLFKPFRSGKDLKNENESWDDAMEKHNFSDQERQWMDNFMLRHECLDARDDYHSERQLEQLDPTWDDTLYGDDSNTMHEIGDMDAGDGLVSNVIGSDEQKRQVALAMMSGIMQ
jgi:hypothetical protein